MVCRETPIEMCFVVQVLSGAAICLFYCEMCFSFLIWLHRCVKGRLFKYVATRCEVEKPVEAIFKPESLSHLTSYCPSRGNRTLFVRQIKSNLRDTCGWVTGADRRCRVDPLRLCGCVISLFLFLDVSNDKTQPYFGQWDYRWHMDTESRRHWWLNWIALELCSH